MKWFIALSVIGLTALVGIWSVVIGAIAAGWISQHDVLGAFGWCGTGTALILLGLYISALLFWDGEKYR